MSVWLQEWRFGDVSGDRRYPGYATIGYPLDGREDLGKVLGHATNNGFFCWLETEQRCCDAHETHDLGRRDSRVACEHCDLVLIDPPTWSYGFRPSISPGGTISCDVAPYDEERHGPFGGANANEAFAKAQQHLERWIAWYGPGPWYAVEHQEPDYGIVYDVFSSTRWEPPEKIGEYMGLEHAYAGPFTTLKEAHTACHERNMNESMNWKRYNWTNLYAEATEDSNRKDGEI